MPPWKSDPRRRPATRFAGLTVTALLAVLAACASGASRMADAMAAAHDTLASAPAGSEATVIYPVSPGSRATLVFLPPGPNIDGAQLRAAGLAPELADRIVAELDYVGPRERAMMVVLQSGLLEFSTAFADSAEVTEVVLGDCAGRCRITLRAAGPGLRPRVVKVG